MIELVLWDLDETLLPSEHLRSARHRHTPCDLLELDEFAGTALHDGVAEALVAAPGVGTGLITSSPRWYVEQILDHLLPDATFDVVVTHEDAPDIKPDPAPLLLALRRAGIDAARSVYVGDDLVDHQACASANVRFLGAGWAHTPTFPSTAETLTHPLELRMVLEAV